MIACSPIEIRCCDLQGILGNNPPSVAGFGAPKRPKLAKFPPFSLRCRESAAESRSQQTAPSTIQSVHFRTFWRIAHNCACACDLRPRMDLENVSCVIRKGQARWVSDDDVRQQNQFIDQLFDLAACDLAVRFLSGPPPSPLLKLQHFHPPGSNSQKPQERRNSI
jgi:hypothetical protein